MWVLHLLQHAQLIIDHLFIALDILLEDYLYGDFLPIWAFCLSDDSICSCAEGPPKLVLRPAFLSIP